MEYFETFAPTLHPRSDILIISPGPLSGGWLYVTRWRQDKCKYPRNKASTNAKKSTNQIDLCPLGVLRRTIEKKVFNKFLISNFLISPETSMNCRPLVKWFKCKPTEKLILTVDQIKNIRNEVCVLNFDWSFHTTKVHYCFIGIPPTKLSVKLSVNKLSVFCIFLQGIMGLHREFAKKYNWTFFEFKFVVVGVIGAI